MRIALLGGSGFIGRHLAAELARRGHSLCIPVRDRERAKEALIMLPDTDVYAYDPNVPAGLKKCLQGADAAVNLVGILNEDGRNLFDRVHGEFVRILAEGCIKNQVPRIVHLSAIGVSPGAPSAYLRSKAKGEQIIKSNDALSHAIIRPSVVFGPGDDFVNRFARLIKYFPVMPLPMAAAKFQPIYVADLVAMVANVLEDDSYHNKTLNAGGGAALALEEIIRLIARQMGKSPRLLPMGSGLSYAFAAVAEQIPFAELITRDNIRSMQLPSVCPQGENHAAAIAGRLTTFENGLAAMMMPESDFGSLRQHARRHS